MSFEIKLASNFRKPSLMGGLEAALEASTAESGNQADTAATAATGDLDNLKSILGDSLSTAFVDGSLEAALEATKSEPREKCIEPVYDYAEAVLLLVESIEYR